MFPFAQLVRVLSEQLILEKKKRGLQSTGPEEPCVFPCPLQPPISQTISDSEWIRISPNVTLQPDGLVRFSLPAYGTTWKRLVLSIPKTTRVLFAILRLQDTFQTNDKLSKEMKETPQLQGVTSNTFTRTTTSHTEVDYSILFASDTDIPNQFLYSSSETKFTMSALENANQIPDSNVWCGLKGIIDASQASDSEQDSFHSDPWTMANIMPGLVLGHTWYLDVCFEEYPTSVTNIHLFAAVEYRNVSSETSAMMASQSSQSARLLSKNTVIEFPVQPILCQPSPNALRVSLYNNNKLPTSDSSKTKAEDTDSSSFAGTSNTASSAVLTAYKSRGRPFSNAISSSIQSYYNSKFANQKCGKSEACGNEDLTVSLSTSAKTSSDMKQKIFSKIAAHHSKHAVLRTSKGETCPLFICLPWQSPLAILFDAVKRAEETRMEFQPENNVAKRTRTPKSVRDLLLAYEEEEQGYKS